VIYFDVENSMNFIKQLASGLVPMQHIHRQNTHTNHTLEPLLTHHSLDPYSFTSNLIKSYSSEHTKQKSL